MFVGRLPVPDDISVLEDLTDERQIDTEVFKLYGLDEDEINVVAPKRKKL